MALTVKDKAWFQEALDATLSEQISNLLVPVMAKLVLLEQRVADLQRQTITALTNLADGLPTAEPPKVEDFVAAVKEPLDGVAPAVLAAMRESVPALFGTAAEVVAPEVGALSRFHLLVETEAYIHAGGAVSRFQKGQTLDRRHFDVPLLKSRGLRIRGVYINELDQLGLKEE